MPNRIFLFLFIAALLLGGGLGGILIVFLPSDEESENLTMSPAALPQPGAGLISGPVEGDAPSVQSLQELGQRVQAGEAEPEELQAELQQLQRQLAQQGGAVRGQPEQTGGVFSSSLTGVVESKDGGVLALDTPVGPLQATVGDNTAVTVLSEEEGTLDDLTTGVQVRLVVEPNDDGSMDAANVFVLPEGVDLSVGSGVGGRLGGLGVGQGAFGGAGGGGQRPNAGLALRGAAAAGGLTGVIESLEGGVLGVNTPIGPIEVSAGDDLVVTVISGNEGDLENLTAGLTVVVSVEPKDDGSAEAISVTIVPEGSGLPLGGGFGRAIGFGGGLGGFGQPEGAR